MFAGCPAGLVGCVCMFVVQESMRPSCFGPHACLPRYLGTWATVTVSGWNAACTSLSARQCVVSPQTYSRVHDVLEHSGQELCPTAASREGAGALEQVQVYGEMARSSRCAAAD